MPRHNFNNSLRLSKPRTTRYGRALRSAPLARGPVADEEQVTWMQVWIFQNTSRGKAAGAYGEGEWSNAPVTESWKIDTELVEDSDDFKAGEPAQATALALVEDKDAKKEFYWWSEAVMIAPPRK
jgi:hypothetical protein